MAKPERLSKVGAEILDTEAEAVKKPVSNETEGSDPRGLVRRDGTDEVIDGVLLEKMARGERGITFSNLGGTALQRHNRLKGIA